MRRIPFFFPLVVLMAALFISPPTTSAKPVPVKIIKQLNGSLLTNVAGTSASQPPYIQIIRSLDGLDYALSQFDRLQNRITTTRIARIKQQLSRVDFDSQMVVGVFSQPMDNFVITIDKVEADREESFVSVFITYAHIIQSYSIPPKKSIEYVLMILPKSLDPVILRATEMKNNVAGVDAKLITVTGRLMPLSDGELQLVPVVIKRGSKNSHYIRGAQSEKLLRYLGKVVTLQGSVSHDTDSPYEFELTVEKVVKVFD
jgi:hypothetical protein